MGALEQRVSSLEVKVEEHSGAIGDLRGLIVALDQKVERLIVGLDQKMDRRFDAFEDRVDRRFNWIVGLQFSTLITIIAGLFGIIATLIRA